MKVLLVNLDSKIPNLALHKIAKYHELRGDRVRPVKDVGTNRLPDPLLIDMYDKIYVSCIFSWNKHHCDKWEGIAEIGGSGYSLDKNLPPDIDVIKPKINWGFITRGCIRKCPWCIVPQKEGKMKVVGDIYDIWDGKSDEIILMDNNILALPKTFFKTCKQIKKENLRVDFNQGLDHRLLTDDICKELFSLRLGVKTGEKIRFAFDDISYERSVLKALDMLERNGLKKWHSRWYIYVGVEDTVETVLHRINIIRERTQSVFVMRDRDEKVMQNEEFRKIYSWSTNQWAYYGLPYSEFKTDRTSDKPDYIFR